jgi:hypothetical protein
VALHKQWRYTNNGAIQTVALQEERRFKNGGATQNRGTSKTVAPNNQCCCTKGDKNSGATQIVALHKEWSYTNSGASKTLSLKIIKNQSVNAV